MTDFLRCSERERIGCERFEAACRRNGFTGEVEKRLAKEWVMGTREWLAVHGENWDLLDEVVDEMRKQHPPLIIASTRSCIKNARERTQWRPRFETEAGRQSFAERLVEPEETDADRQTRQRYADAVQEARET